METQHDHLYKVRHSLAHVLAQAVLQIRPTAKLAFGPPVDNGCYYDFLFDVSLTPEDFADIEKRIRKIINERQPFVGSSLTTEEATQRLEAAGQYLKVEYCRELTERGEKTIGFYSNGTFVDMCAGPHLEHTGQIPPDCFKLDSIAGAYWRGSEKNPQLARLYCLAFENKKSLNDYIERRKLAQERDHRKLGKELELFFMAEEVGPGLPLWLPNGTAIKEALEAYAKEQEQRLDYQRVSTPLIAKEQLYITSGHLPYYKDSMFPPMKLEGESDYYLKGMNCPHHHLIFGHRTRSYRELPLRIAEYGSCHRFESSGTLSGLLRVRSMCMNDAHIYCTLDQMKHEMRLTLKLILDYYALFRMEGTRVRISTHDPANKEKFIDDPKAWEFTEQAVQDVVREMGIEFDIGLGDAAFYGPKVDVQAKTVIGREETLSTTQLDFAGATRFNLLYTGEDGKEHRPYIIHRAPLSTHERFLAFLIEHLGGAFPTWMSPVQVALIPVSLEFEPYAREIEQLLKRNLFRIEVDLSENSFNKKIREAVTRKIPNILIFGGKEVGLRQITLRRYCTKEQITMPIEQFMNRMEVLTRDRLMDNFVDTEIPA